MAPQARPRGTSKGARPRTPRQARVACAKPCEDTVRKETVKEVFVTDAPCTKQEAPPVAPQAEVREEECQECGSPAVALVCATEAELGDLEAQHSAVRRKLHEAATIGQQLLVEQSALEQQLQPSLALGSKRGSSDASVQADIVRLRKENMQLAKEVEEAEESSLHNSQLQKRRLEEKHHQELVRELEDVSQAAEDAARLREAERSSLQRELQLVQRQWSSTASILERNIDAVRHRSDKLREDLLEARQQRREISSQIHDVIAQQTLQLSRLRRELDEAKLAVAEQQRRAAEDTAPASPDSSPRESGGGAGPVCAPPRASEVVDADEDSSSSSSTSSRDSSPSSSDSETPSSTHWHALLSARGPGRGRVRASTGGMPSFW
mmetsp:Transcript_44930/g.106676  ORF Transcript_44930/g.106676 Transcript_44930/m.106676 type:complete len:380 (-) Transcript_44930:92-1231(-)